MKIKESATQKLGQGKDVHSHKERQLLEGVQGSRAGQMHLQAPCGVTEAETQPTASPPGKG